MKKRKELARWTDVNATKQGEKSTGKSLVVSQKWTIAVKWHSHTLGISHSKQEEH